MSVLVHVGEVLSGRITATIPVTAATWSATLNDSGAVTATVAEEIVKKYDLRHMTEGNRCFLAFERDGRIKQAGPIRSRSWDWSTGTLTLGAVGIWGWLDKRVIIRPTATYPYQKTTTTITGKSLGGIARALVQQAISSSYCDVPIVLPADEVGAHTESFPMYAVLKYGDQLRQLTQRATDAPDIAFVPRRTAADPRYIEWVMRVGTEVAPALQQDGPDWIFDSSAPRSGVFGISTDEDSTGMAQEVWATGNGQEESILLAYNFDLTLLNAGWPLTDADASFPTIEDVGTLQGQANNLLNQSARPIESFKATVAAETVEQVEAGDFCQVITKGDVWLGDMQREMRVKTISGDLTDKVTLEMFPLAGLL